MAEYINQDIKRAEFLKSLKEEINLKKEYKKKVMENVGKSIELGFKLGEEKSGIDDDDVPYNYVEKKILKSTNLEDAESFEEYINQNPRKFFPNSLIRDFLVYAKKKYKKYPRINWGDLTKDLDDETLEIEVERYVNNSAEILLLFIEFIQERGEAMAHKVLKKSSSELV